jgi:hypothetical protein
MFEVERVHAVDADEQHSSDARIAIRSPTCRFRCRASSRKSVK